MNNDYKQLDGYALHAAVNARMSYERNPAKLTSIIEQIQLTGDLSALKSFLNDKDLTEKGKIDLLIRAIGLIEEKANGNRPRTREEIEAAVYDDLTHE